MGLFLSYSSRDRAGIDDLLSALHRAQEDVWFDEDLGGGQAWWQMILERIRGCDVFVFAMSQNSLDSKPCQAELRYAQSLGKPVLPIQIGPVGSMRVTPLAAVEVIDFQHPTVETGIRLMTAVQDARRRANPLPSPLPDEPPVPFAYLMRVAAAVAEADLDPQEQTELIGRLRTAVHEDGGDPTTRGDIVQLLRTLRDRPDATEQTRIEAIAMLKALGRASGHGRVWRSVLRGIHRVVNGATGGAVTEAGRDSAQSRRDGDRHGGGDHAGGPRLQQLVQSARQLRSAGMPRCRQCGYK